MLRSPLGRARGLGAAKDGVSHFWLQRLTAVALVPLLMWFVISLIRVAGADYAVFKAFVGQPFNASMLILLAGTGCFHAQLGLTVVAEDYLSCPCKKWAAVIAVRLVTVFLAVGMTVSILKVAVGV